LRFQKHPATAADTGFDHHKAILRLTERGDC
jgi:hypothetical protein